MKPSWEVRPIPTAIQRRPSLELVNLRFEDGAGNARVVHGAFADIGIGWTPG